MPSSRFVKSERWLPRAFRLSLPQLACQYRLNSAFVDGTRRIGTGGAAIHVLHRWLVKAGGGGDPARPGGVACGHAGIRRAACTRPAAGGDLDTVVFTSGLVVLDFTGNIVTRFSLVGHQVNGCDLLTRRDPVRAASKARVSA